jgi:hypothetical protein
LVEEVRPASGTVPVPPSVDVVPSVRPANPPEEPDIWGPAGGATPATTPVRPAGGLPRPVIVPERAP